MSLAMKSSRFEPQGSYFDQYPDRRTRLNSYAAPIPTHSTTPSSSSSSSSAIISSPRRVTVSSRGPVKVIAAAELWSTPIASRFSSPPLPPADLGLLQRARKGSANGPTSSPFPSASSEMPFSSSKAPVTSKTETSPTRTVFTEAPRRRSLSSPHASIAVDHASETTRNPPPKRSALADGLMNKGFSRDENDISGNGSPSTIGAASSHQSKRSDRVPFPPVSSDPEKARRSEMVQANVTTPTPQSPPAFLVHPDRPKPKSARPAGGKNLLLVPTPPRAATVKSPTAHENTIKVERRDDQYSTTSSASAGSRFSFIRPGSRISKLFSSRSTSSLNSTPPGILTSPSVPETNHPDQRQHTLSTSSRGSSTRDLGTTGVHTGSSQTLVIDIFAGPGVYDPLHGVYQSNPSSLSTHDSSLHAQGSQHPGGLPVPPDEFGGRGVLARGGSAPPDLDGLVASMNGRLIGGSRGEAWSSSKKKNQALVRSGKGSSPVDAWKSAGEAERSVEDEVPRGDGERRESIPDVQTPSELMSVSVERDLQPPRVVDEIQDGPLFGGVVRPSPVLQAGPSQTPSPQLERYSFIAPVGKSISADAEVIKENDTSLKFPVITSSVDETSLIGVEDESTSTNTCRHSIPNTSKMTAELESLRPTPPTLILSIDEIVRQHAGASYLSKMAASAEKTKEGPTRIGRSNPATFATNLLRPSVDGDLKQSLSECLDLQDRLEGCGADDVFLEMTKLPARSVSDDTRSMSAKSSHSQRPSRSSVTPRSSLRKLSTANVYTPESLRVERDIAQVLRSSKLTRLLTLRRPPNLGLTVSYADVGAPHGHPVLVHLGLGCVRYIMALYDEMAKAYNLRIICVDRWGLGRTSAIPDSRRGFTEWAFVMDEIIDHLGLGTYSILAHSAGGPYAVASALGEASSRVRGSLHLLAPWIVSTSSEALAGAYKLLKYVPRGVLRNAQMADWKMTTKRLGKPPTIQHTAVGYDARQGKLRWTGGGDGTINSTLEDEERQTKDGMGEVPDSTDSISQTSSKPRPRRLSTFSLKTRSTRSFIESFRSVSSPLPPPRYDESLSSELSTSSPEMNGAQLCTPHGRRDRLGLSKQRASLDPSSFPSTTPSSSIPLIPPTLTGTDLGQGLLRACHAESLRGSTSDLALLLNRSSKTLTNNNGVPNDATTGHLESRYLDLKMKLKIWHGDKDERISLGSVRTLQARLGNDRCELKVVEYANHQLITNAKVIGEVFESIAEEWK